jgi:hypothetical protein
MSAVWEYAAKPYFKIKSDWKSIVISANYPEIPKGKPWGSEDQRSNVPWPTNLKIPRTSLGDFKDVCNDEGSALERSVPRLRLEVAA